MEVFKKNQKVIATLPDGRVVEGVYIEPYGSDGHSFYVNQFNGIGKNDDPVYKKVTYGVKEGNIVAKPKEPSKPSEKQYQAWLKRKEDIESHIKEEEDNMASTLVIGENDKSREKFQKKIDRYKEKLAEIEKKIKEYEDDGTEE